MRKLMMSSLLALTACSTVNGMANSAAHGAASGFGSRLTSGGGSAASSTAPAVAARGPDDDDHWFQPDDFVISERGYEGAGYIWVTLSKMRTPPGAATKDQGLFFMVHDAKEIWTAHYWKTRPAAQGEAALGATVICFNSNEHDGVRQAPRDKDNARHGGWFMARVTDTSDLYRGYVTTSGGKCAPAALRVAMK